MPCSGGRSIMRLRGVSVSQVLVPKTILMQTGSCLKHKIKFCTHFYMVLKIKRLNEQCSLCKIWYGVYVSLLDRHTLCVCVCIIAVIHYSHVLLNVLWPLTSNIILPIQMGCKQDSLKKFFLNDAMQMFWPISFGKDLLFVASWMNKLLDLLQTNPKPIPISVSDAINLYQQNKIVKSNNRIRSFVVMNF